MSIDDCRASLESRHRLDRIYKWEFNDLLCRIQVIALDKITEGKIGEDLTDALFEVRIEKQKIQNEINKILKRLLDESEWIQRMIGYAEIIANE